MLGNNSAWIICVCIILAYLLYAVKWFRGPLYCIAIILNNHVKEIMEDSLIIFYITYCLQYLSLDIDSQYLCCWENYYVVTADHQDSGAFFTFTSHVSAAQVLTMAKRWTSWRWPVWFTIDTSSPLVTCWWVRKTLAAKLTKCNRLLTCKRQMVNISESLIGSGTDLSEHRSNVTGSSPDTSAPPPGLAGGRGRAWCPARCSCPGSPPPAR